MKLEIKKVDSMAVVPKYAHESDAGFDLYSVDFGELKPGETRVFSTGLKMAIPEGYAVSIRPRSGLSLNSYLRIANAPGTIDSGYRGEVGVILHNTGNKIAHINVGDRIAQGVLTRVPKAEFEVVDELSETIRGEGGYGSSGIK